MNDIRKLPEALDRVKDGARHVAGHDGAPRGISSQTTTAGIAALVWVATFLFARFALESTALTAPMRVAIALVPVPAFAWFLWAFIAIMRGADELERRIQLEALAVAFPLTALLFMTLGLMQLAIPLSPDDWSYRHTWPIMFVFYLLGLTIARRRYA